MSHLIKLNRCAKVVLGSSSKTRNIFLFSSARTTNAPSNPSCEVLSNLSRIHSGSLYSSIDSSPRRSSVLDTPHHQYFSVKTRQRVIPASFEHKGILHVRGRTAVEVFFRRYLPKGTTQTLVDLTQIRCTFLICPRSPAGLGCFGVKIKSLSAEHADAIHPADCGIRGDNLGDVLGKPARIQKRGILDAIPADRLGM